MANPYLSLSLIPETLTVEKIGLVRLLVHDSTAMSNGNPRDAVLSLMLFTRQARMLRDALNALDLEDSDA